MLHGNLLKSILRFTSGFESYLSVSPRITQPIPECHHIGSRPDTLFQNGRHFSVFLFTCKLALVTSFANSKFKEYFPLNEATRTNLQVNKRIPKWGPFWNKVYINPKLKSIGLKREKDQLVLNYCTDCIAECLFLKFFNFLPRLLNSNTADFLLVVVS